MIRGASDGRWGCAWEDGAKWQDASWQTWDNGDAGWARDSQRSPPSSSARKAPPSSSAKTENDPKLNFGLVTREGMKKLVGCASAAA